MIPSAPSACPGVSPLATSTTTGIMKSHRFEIHRHVAPKSHSMAVLARRPFASSHFYVQLNIHKVVSAKRASALVAALEPPEQTNRVECVLAGGATLVRRLHVG